MLIPDFEGNEAALAVVAAAKPDILNHNIETVRRLFPSIRPQGKYQRSIELLGRAKQMGMTTKSGLIVGMGETTDEAREVMRDLRSVECDIMTIGQYLQPTKEHLAVARFYHPGRIRRSERRRPCLRLSPRRIRPAGPQLLPCGTASGRMLKRASGAVLTALKVSTYSSKVRRASPSYRPSREPC